MSINPTSRDEGRPDEPTRTDERKMSKMLPAARPTVPVTITAAAVDKIAEYRQEHEEFAGKAFRIRVDGGGCAGFRYAFEFDDARDDDLRIPAGDVEVVIDPLSIAYLKDSTVDFFSSLMSSGFVVSNPNSTSSCGCGHSFGV
ncbi:MAG: iron-sulfur cluster assembly accessory protein [Acidobacteriota bacterium]|nr:iron-sulfur cluster assembly accessory protein [Acidobacteriota bacterium]